MMRCHFSSCSLYSWNIILKCINLEFIFLCWAFSEESLSASTLLVSIPSLLTSFHFFFSFLLFSYFWCFPFYFSHLLFSFFFSYLFSLHHYILSLQYSSFFFILSLLLFLLSSLFLHFFLNVLLHLLSSSVSCLL